MINPQTQLNLVIGHPLQHTQSPVLHNTVYPLLNCNAVMLAKDSPDLASMIQAIKALSVGLTAVTMPFKQAILSYLDERSPEVEALKAANTVLYRNQKLIGYNTDVDGIAYALRHIALSNKKVLMIGAGGAARAAAYYMQKNHADLLWLNRTPDHAISLAETFTGDLVNLAQINNLSIDIFINTTPVGLYPHIHHSPLPDYPFKSSQVVFDMVYNPADTALIKAAKLQGATTISGLDMFIAQGLKQIELWLDKTIDIAKIMTLIKTALENARHEMAG